MKPAPRTAQKCMAEVTPQDQIRALNVALFSVENMPGLANIPGGASYLRTELQRLKARAAAPVVFRHLGNGAYQVGRGDEVRMVTSRCSGVRAVWSLLSRPGKPLPVEEIASPDAKHAADVARRAIRSTATAEFTAWALPELATAARNCHVVDGMVWLRLPGNAPTYLTD